MISGGIRFQSRLGSYSTTPWTFWFLNGAERLFHEADVSEPVSPALCKAYALECRRMAAYAPSSRQREVLLDLAQEWERLSAQIGQRAGALE